MQTPDGTNIIKQGYAQRGPIRAWSYTPFNFIPPGY